MSTGGQLSDYEASDRSALRSLELNPDLPEAQWGYADSLVERDRHEDALRQLKQWVERDPQAARAVAGGFYAYPALQNDRRLVDINDRAEFRPVLDKARRRYEEFKAVVEAES